MLDLKENVLETVVLELKEAVLGLASTKLGDGIDLSGRFNAEDDDDNDEDDEEEDIADFRFFHFLYCCFLSYFVFIDLIVFCNICSIVASYCIYKTNQRRSL